MQRNCKGGEAENMVKEEKCDKEHRINYDTVKKLHDHAEFLKHEMQSVINHSYRQKIRAQAMGLYHAFDTIVTYTMSRSKALYQWNTFVVDMMGCCYLFLGIYNSMRFELHDVFEACYNSDELRDAFNWMVKVLSKSTEQVMLKDRYTWIDGK